MQHRVKSKVEKGSQDVPAGQVPRKAATFEEFKQAPAHLRVFEVCTFGEPFTSHSPLRVPESPLWHMH